MTKIKIQRNPLPGAPDNNSSPQKMAMGGVRHVRCGIPELDAPPMRKTEFATRCWTPGTLNFTVQEAIAIGSGIIAA